MKLYYRIIILSILIQFCFMATVTGDEGSNMDIKTKIENFLINITLGRALEKRESVFCDGEKETIECIRNFYAVVNTHDAIGLKKLFAKNAIDEIGENTLESMINNFLSYFSGEYIDCVNTVVSSKGKIEHGKKSDELESSADIISTKTEYKMAIKLIPYDDFDSDNIGIWSISIILKSKDTKPEIRYCGDGHYRTGIYFDIPRPVR